ncbi:Ig-like domain repeat protein [Lentzea sp. CA-135723]|uniref:Ig-like domain-containing protein n=1 Tax=Lentzea sp. CA-135723 TaxID=3239950 RepID=UPI003D95060B
MRTNLRRIAAGAAVVAVSVMAALGTSGTALAAPPVGNLGTLSVSKQSGNDLDALTYVTSAPCASGSDGYNLFVYGPGGFTNGLIGTTPTDVGFSTSAPITVLQGLSFRDIAVDNTTTITPGTYTIAVNCVDLFSQEVVGTFTRTIFFTSATAWQATDPSAPVTTTTALSVAPNAPVVQGTSVTLTANVTPASATGTVQFKDGAGNLGNPVAVSNGVASLVTTALPVGARQLSAVFTGSAGNITGSTSAVVSYQVNAPVATPTTTSLAVTPGGTAAQFSTVTLNATVAPAGAAGSVQFLDGAANLGNPVAVSGGSATLTTSALAVGSHSLTARFVPASGAFETSVSAAIPLEITAFAGVSASETITTEVKAGELLISVANQNVTLPSPVMAADGSLLTTAGALNPITVTDTRAGNPGWNVSGQVTDFASGANAINGANLGWTPKIVDKSPVQNITAGPNVDPANALVPGASAPNGLGLAAARTLATAASLGGNGTANLSADLALKVPTSTQAGTYTATLTLTAI